MPDTYSVRIASTTEDSLKKCIRRRIWAARHKLPREWNIDDILLVRVENSLAAIAMVKSQLTHNSKASFDEEFPLVAKVDWIWVAQKLGERIPFGEWIKSELRSAWGTHYGFRVLNQSALPSKQARHVLNELKTQLPQLPDILKKKISGKGK